MAAENEQSVSVAGEAGRFVMVWALKCLEEPYSGKAAESFWILNPFLELGFQSD